jgi:hypothetical protein
VRLTCCHALVIRCAKEFFRLTGVRLSFMTADIIWLAKTFRSQPWNGEGGFMSDFAMASATASAQAASVATHLARSPLPVTRAIDTDASYDQSGSYPAR